MKFKVQKTFNEEILSIEYFEEIEDAKESFWKEFEAIESDIGLTIRDENENIVKPL